MDNEYIAAQTAPLTQPTEWRKNGYLLSADHARLDRAFVHRFLSQQAWWAKDMPYDICMRAIDHSLCFGIYAPSSGQQVGFARVVSDHAVFAYLRDVFVLPEHGGRGLASWACACMREHPRLRTVRSWLLATSDAHGVYAKAGFSAASHPEWYMQFKKEGWDDA